MGKAARFCRLLAAMMREAKPAAGSVCPTKPLLAIRSTGLPCGLPPKMVEAAPSSMGSPRGVPAHASDVCSRQLPYHDILSCHCLSQIADFRRNSDSVHPRQTFCYAGGQGEPRFTTWFCMHLLKCTCRTCRRGDAADLMCCDAATMVMCGKVSNRQHTCAM